MARVVSVVARGGRGESAAAIALDSRVWIPNVFKGWCGCWRYRRGVIDCRHRGRSSVGRALASQAGCRRFEPGRPLCLFGMSGEDSHLWVRVCPPFDLIH